MSYLFAIFMAALAIGGMNNRADWHYWMSAWAICALFTLSGNISVLISNIRKEKKDE